jgi:chromatin remodeling complex protein RSC6
MLPQDSETGPSQAARILQRLCHGNLMTETKTAPKTAAFMKPLIPSAELAAIVGTQPLARTEVTKRLWDYIKARNLQNPANKRNVLCDAQLKAVMGKDEVTMFEMTKLVGQHLKAA